MAVAEVDYLNGGGEAIPLVYEIVANEYEISAERTYTATESGNYIVFADGVYQNVSNDVSVNLATTGNILNSDVFVDGTAKHMKGFFWNIHLDVGDTITTSLTGTKYSYAICKVGTRVYDVEYGNVVARDNVTVSYSNTKDTEKFFIMFCMARGSSSSSSLTSSNVGLYNTNTVTGNKIGITLGGVLTGSGSGSNWGNAMICCVSAKL